MKVKKNIDNATFSLNKLNMLIRKNSYIFFREFINVVNIIITMNLTFD